MSATTKIWTNGIAPTCEDADLNGFKNENNNLIVGSGQGLSTADNQQSHKAVAHYAGVGDFYVDSGVANAYVLSTTGAQVAPATYATGMRIRFVPGNTNGTGASTVNVAGLGVKTLVQDLGGVPTEQFDVRAGVQLEAYYDGAEFRIVSPTSLDSLGYAPTLTASGGGAPTYNLQQSAVKRLGRLTIAHGQISLTTVGTLSGSLFVNLPTTPTVLTLGPVQASIGRISNTNLSPLPFFGLNYVSPTTIGIYKDSLPLLAADINSNFLIEYTLTYFE